MKKNIKEVLDELTNYGKKRVRLKRIEKLEDIIGVDFTLTIVKEILYWQKLIISGNNFVDDDIKEGKYIVDELLLDKYEQFFEFFDDIKDVFILGKYEEEEEVCVSFNPDLTSEEIEGIQTYIHDNYQIQIRIRRS